jgi:hypothetical protein
MRKRITISISEYVFAEYLRDIETNNRSNYIEGLIVKGSMYIIDEQSSLKTKIISIKQELDNLKAEVKRLRFENIKLKTKNKNYTDPELAIKEKMVKALRKAGLK